MTHRNTPSLSLRTILFGTASVLVGGFLCYAWQRIVSANRDLLNLEALPNIHPINIESNPKTFSAALQESPEDIQNMIRELVAGGETAALVLDMSIDENMSNPKFGVYNGDIYFQTRTCDSRTISDVVAIGTTMDIKRKPPEIFLMCRSVINPDAFYHGVEDFEEGNKSYSLARDVTDIFNLPGYLDDREETGYVYYVMPYLGDGKYVILVATLETAHVHHLMNSVTSDSDLV